jgi:hypothetical protein
MKKLIIASMFLLSFSAFSQSEVKCAKAIATLAGSAHDLGIYEEKVRAVEIEQERSQEDPAILSAKLGALKGIRTAKRAVFNMSANLISVSCMSANMLQSGSHIRNEIEARLPDDSEE